MLNLRDILRGGLDEEIVLGTDERERVPDTRKPPYCWICSLEVEFPKPVINTLGALEQIGKKWQDMAVGQQGCGSGLLIGPNRILTACHVVIGLRLLPGITPGEHWLQAVLPRCIRAIPGRNADSVPFGVWEVAKVHANPRFCSLVSGRANEITRSQVLQALPYDVAILELAPQKAPRTPHPGEQIGWWGREAGYHWLPLKEATNASLSGRIAHIGGFPGEKGDKPCSLPYHSRGTILTASPTLQGQHLPLLLYEADTSAGMSGSPVWVTSRAGIRYLVGVHTSFSRFLNRRTGQQDICNLGVLVNTRVADSR